MNEETIKVFWMMGIFAVAGCLWLYFIYREEKAWEDHCNRWSEAMKRRVKNMETFDEFKERKRKEMQNE